MKTTRLTALALATLLGAAALPALADNSTGPTNPAMTGTKGHTGTQPGTLATPDGKHPGTASGAATTETAPSSDVTEPQNGNNDIDTPEDNADEEGSGTGK